MFPARRGYRIVAAVHVTPLESTSPSVHIIANGTRANSYSNKTRASSEGTGTRAGCDNTRAWVFRGVGEVYEPVFKTPLLFPETTTDRLNVHPDSLVTDTLHQHNHAIVTDSLSELKSIIDDAVATLTGLGPLTDTALTPTPPGVSPSPGPGPSPGPSPCLDSAEAVGVLVHRLMLLLSSSSDNNHNDITTSTTNTTATSTSTGVTEGAENTNGFSSSGTTKQCNKHTRAVAYYGFEQALLHAFARYAGK